MCILTDGNQIQIGFGLLKVNVFSYDWYHLTFIFQVPYKKFEKDNTSNIYHIYICYDIFFAGEDTCFSISVITYSMQGENI